MKLLILNDNWADEIDCEGFMVVTEEEYKKWSDWLDKKKTFWFSIGTNEDLEYKDKADLLSKITVKDISDDEAIFLTGTLGKWFGIFPMDLDMLDWDDEEDDEEDDNGND